MASSFTWPKPYLLDLYAKAVKEGCIRIKLRGPDFDAEWRSFKAAFLRLRRKKDSNFFVQMEPAYQMVSLRYEPETQKVLIIYSALPDDELLPSIEAVDGKTNLPQPKGAVPHHTPETELEEFDADAHVRGMIENLRIEEDGDEPATEL